MRLLDNGADNRRVNIENLVRRLKETQLSFVWDQKQ